MTEIVERGSVGVLRMESAIVLYHIWGKEQPRWGQEKHAWRPIIGIVVAMLGEGDKRQYVFKPHPGHLTAQQLHDIADFLEDTARSSSS
jgi:hypothetical protein